MTASARGFPTRAEALTALHAKLTAAVDDLVEGEAWQRMLRIAAHLPHYSPSNVLLIATQRPEATCVMGYRGWEQHGRHVLKGEKGIAILAPCLYQEPEEPLPTPDGPHPATADATARRVLRGYRVVHVFDITQTDGKPLGDQPLLLHGAVPDRLYDGLAVQVAAQGFTLTRGDCHGANGYTDYATREVRVRDDVEPAQAAKTLAHELGHIRADHEHRFLDPSHRTVRCRGLAEVEAESIAYLVVSAAGLDSGGYSVPYLAGWSGGDTSVLRDAATWAISMATEIDKQLVAYMARAAVAVDSPTLAPPGFG